MLNQRSSSTGGLASQGSSPDSALKGEIMAQNCKNQQGVVIRIIG